MRWSTSCKDCGVDVHEINEYSYMVTYKTWADAGNPRPSRHDCDIARMLWEAGVIDESQLNRHWDSGGKLCIECLEKRLARKLTPDDFNWNVPITNMGSEFGSDRLRDRMSRY